ncbi:MAG: tRNA 2-thiouridine(34) synthase MnmA [Fusobacteriaceae bacterium]
MKKLLNELKKLSKYDEKNKNIRVAVAMSGGVDSSTVAYLLKEQGYDIFGVTMKTCKAEDSDAKKVCEDLGIDYYLYDATESFKTKVIDVFVDEYVSGRTPNPCMVCNRHVKFGELLEFARSKGADFMATGHYAKIIDGTLAIGDDPKKDQVYFLSGIKRENIQYIMFPIGDLEKTLVRGLAEELGVRVYDKKDSQEICFVDDGKLGEFLIERSGGKAAKSGDIVNSEGKILGKHKGISFYTIGQRKGLGIPGETPLYVIKLDAEKNQVIVGSNEELFKNKILANQLNFLTVNSLEELKNQEVFVKTRSRDMLHSCKIEILGEDEIEVTMTSEKVRAVTPGQGIVFYDKIGRVVASGFIK